MKRLWLSASIVLLTFACKPSAVRNLSTPQVTTVAGQSLVQVEFAGLTAFIEQGRTRRVVFVRDDPTKPNHKVVLTIPEVYKSEVEAIFGANTCVPDGTLPECSVKGLDEFEIRIVDEVGDPPTNPYQAIDFSTNVPKLKTKGVTTLHADVLASTPNPRGRIYGWFTLDDRGEAIPTPFVCSGYFDDDSTQTGRPFPKNVIVSFFTAKRARLEVKLRGGAPQFVKFNASLVQLRLENEPQKDKRKSHFHAFGQLNDPAKKLADVKKKKPLCKESVGTEAGCGNSNWP